MRNNVLGKKGEEIALNYLISNHFQILACNYRYKHSEIDIICSKDQLLVFVEVKYRTSMVFGFPEESVKSLKINKIREAAEEYIFEIDWKKDIRFDVIAITDINNQIDIEHLKDAF
ncbi:MAG: YraN family protein [Bacteroidota bacterium]|nr:YraN family protein [Bacteroidota bacterium]